MIMISTLGISRFFDWSDVCGVVIRMVSSSIEAVWRKNVDDEELRPIMPIPVKTNSTMYQSSHTAIPRRCRVSVLDD
jgi:hypothetical protein